MSGALTISIRERRPVEIDVARGGVLVVDELARVLLHVDPDDAHPFPLPVHVHVDVPVSARVRRLGDLVSLGRSG
jgi:hypothetical protein